MKISRRLMLCLYAFLVTACWGVICGFGGEANGRSGAMTNYSGNGVANNPGGYSEGARSGADSSQTQQTDDSATDNPRPEAISLVGRTGGTIAGNKNAATRVAIDGGTPQTPAAFEETHSSQLNGSARLIAATGGQALASISSAEPEAALQQPSTVDPAGREPTDSPQSPMQPASDLPATASPLPASSPAAAPTPSQNLVTNEVPASYAQKYGWQVFNQWQISQAQAGVQ
jgi:hypothetical protein